MEGLHASHDGRRHPLARPVASLGYLLEGPPNVYFAGDTDLFPGMSALAGRVDVALLPVAGWGPRLPAGHMDPVRAADAVALIRPRLAVPIHWGTLRAWGAQRDLDPTAPARGFADAVGRKAQAPKSGSSCLVSARHCPDEGACPVREPDEMVTPYGSLSPTTITERFRDEMGVGASVNLRHRVGYLGANCVVTVR